MLFSYHVLTPQREPREGTIDATSIDAAINMLQRRGYTVERIEPLIEKASLLGMEFTFLERVTNKEVVIFSRQISTLFEAQVSPLRVFRLLAAETENPMLRRVLTEVADDIQAGNSISVAMSRHPDVFSAFYVSMVHAGEESGKLASIFTNLADYLDRTYEVMAKARNALIYPAFVIFVFVAVMTLMMTLVVPRVSTIIVDSGQEIPIFTKIVIGISNIMVNYIVLILFAIAGIGVAIYFFLRTEEGKRFFDELKLAIPYLGSLYQKLYLSRIADIFSTLLSSGLSMLQTLEITAEVVGNRVYRDILDETAREVQAGRAVSDIFGEYPEIPGVMVSMIKAGEETGGVANILETVAKFYRREVNNAVDTLINMIEPAMIVLLGAGVGVLLAAILMPIYNIASGI